MSGKRYIYAGAVGLAVAAALSLSVSITQADTKKAPKLPSFAVDGSFPKLPAACSCPR